MTMEGGKIYKSRIEDIKIWPAWRAPDYDRKKKTIKELQAECKKRNIGFMTSWTKMALVKRLEDEDSREEEIEKLKSALEKKEEEIEYLGSDKPLDDARKALTEVEQQLRNYDKQINKLMEQKFELMQKSQKGLKEKEQLQALIKSLK